MNALYAERDGQLALRGQNCLRCNRVSFPPNPYGCEQCGAQGNGVADILLDGRGRTLAAVQVNRAIRPNIAVPYQVASIALADGPVIRALVDAGTIAPLRAGTPVEAVLVAAPDGENDQPKYVRFCAVEQV